MDRKDVIPLSRDFPFNLYRTHGIKGEGSLHFHDCLELDLVLEGRGMYRIEEQEIPMTPGDLYIINNLEHHMSFDSDALRLLVLVFDPSLVTGLSQADEDYIKPFFHRSTYFKNRITPDAPSYGELKTLMLKAEEEWTKKDIGYRLVIKALLMQMLALLFRHAASEEVSGESRSSFKKSYDSIRTAIRYIHAHYNEPITLAQIAEVAAMNKSYFSTRFKKVMNRSLTDYIELLRLQQARILLTTTDLSILDISLETSWKNLSWFNRSFKNKFQLTPTQYRHQFHDDAALRISPVHESAIQ